MEIERATEHIVRTLGMEILSDKEAFCNCMEDILPLVPEQCEIVRMVYDDRIGKILVSALRAQVGEREAYKKEIFYCLLKRGMSLEYNKTFLGYFRWVFDKSMSKLSAQNINSQVLPTVSKSQNSGNNKEDALKNIKVGCCVKFGKYPYWQQGREEPLVWRVLDIQGDKALLVSNEVVDYLPAADSLDCSSWKESFLATWLNSVFYVKAFNNMEMARLVINRSVNQFITVPSTEELVLYYSDNPKSHLPSFAEGKAKALQTPYVTDKSKAKALRTNPYVTDKNKESENRYITWWLRDFMIGKGRVKYVSKDGMLVEPRFDGGAMKSKGVRPLIWVKI